MQDVCSRLTTCERAERFVLNRKVLPFVCFIFKLIIKKFINEKRGTSARLDDAMDAARALFLSLHDNAYQYQNCIKLTRAYKTYKDFNLPHIISP